MSRKLIAIVESAALRICSSASSARLDALLTDIRLPGADGWAVARAFRDAFPIYPSCM